MPTQVTLIRHAQSQASLNGIVAGHRSCTGLSTQGIRETQRLVSRVVATGELQDASVLLTSVLRRAVETAMLLRPALADNIMVGSDCSLCERHPGRYDGFLVRDAGGFHCRGDPWASPGGAESRGHFLTRCIRTLRRIGANYGGQHVVVVTHGGVILASFHAFSSAQRPNVPAMVVRNTSLTRWRSVEEDPHTSWELIAFNDAGHLTA